jgi:hypothetical protein
LDLRAVDGTIGGSALTSGTSLSAPSVRQFAACAVLVASIVMHVVASAGSNSIFATVLGLLAFLYRTAKPQRAKGFQEVDVTSH